MTLACPTLVDEQVAGIGYVDANRLVLHTVILAHETAPTK